MSEPDTPVVPDPGATLPFKRSEHGALPLDPTPVPVGPVMVPKRPLIQGSSFGLGFLTGFALASCTSTGILLATFLLG